MKEIDILAHAFQELLKGIEHDPNLEQKEKYFEFNLWQDKFVAFPNSIRSPYLRVFNLLKKKAKDRNLIVSGSKLREILTKFLIETYYSPHRELVLGNIHKVVNDLLGKMRDALLSEYLVMIPLINIHAETDLKIGRVEIVDLTIGKIHELNSKYKMDLPEDESELVQKIQGDSRHPTISIVFVKAQDRDKAEQMAMQATEQALNVLRFYTNDCRVLIKGEVLPSCQPGVLEGIYD
ncbi:MAG: hypothetical protein M3O68_06430 [Thermoproteota archaeon]|nr:hypothetical protein [Thermoproteota archaeon]